MSSNTFKTVKSIFKETYSEQKPRLPKLKKMFSSKKATAQLEASKDPMKYLEKMKNPSIKKLKGVAF